MAKLKLDNGNVLRIKAIKNSEGHVEIIVRDGAYRDGHSYLAFIGPDGILRTCSSLKGLIVDGLQYDKDGGIKVERD